MKTIDPRRVEADLSSPVTLVTAVDGTRRNVMAATQVTILSYEPTLVAVAISPSHYTYELIAASGEFAISIAAVEQLEMVRGVGRSKGRDVDKFEQFGVETAPAESVAAPLIKGCLAALECRVRQIVPTGDHRLIVGEVLAHHHYEEARPLVLFGGKLG